MMMRKVLFVPPSCAGTISSSRTLQLFIHGVSDIVLDRASRFLEFLDRFSDPASELRKLFRSEKEDENDENDNDFGPIEILDKC